MRNRNRTQIISVLFDITLNFLGLFVMMYLSELLVQTPIFGGALFTAGQFWIIFSRLYSKKSIAWLPSNIRNRGIVLFVLSLALTVLLIIVYPSVTSRPTSLLLFAVIILYMLREMITDLLAARLSFKRSRQILILLAVHMLFIGAVMLIFRVGVSDYPYNTVLISLCIVGFVLFIKQIFFALPEETAEPPKVSTDSIMEVASYRIYNRMVVSVLVAVNLSITMYICHLRYLPYKGFISSLLGLLVWLCFVLAVTTVFVITISRRTKGRYDKPALFVIGALLWIIPTVLVFGGVWSMSGYNVYLLGCMYGIGLACMLSIMISMGVEMKDVIEIGVGKIDNGSYTHNTQVMVEWSALLASLLILTMLTLSSFIMDGKLVELDQYVVFPELIQLVSYLLPMFCVIVALTLFVIQPLDREYVRKLREYRRQLGKGELNPALENRLKKALVASASKRIGIRILKFFVRPFVPLRLKGKENIRLQDMPVVFICNHFEIYGPVAAIIRIPYYFRPWIIHRMLDRDIILDTMKNGVDTVFPFLPAAARRGLSKLAAPLILWIFRSLDPIPVYRTDRRSVVKTLRLTVEALECNDNILLFPENPRQEPKGKYLTEGGVSDFYSGFANIGKSYYQKTGNAVTFIPIYINKQKRTMTFGKGVQYNPDAPKTEEKKRIVDDLHQQMSDMAAQ